MKTLHAFLTTTLLFCGSFCFAEWRDTKFVKFAKREMTEAEGIAYLREYDKEFTLPVAGVTNGKIFAHDKNFSSTVCLRHLNNRVDYEIAILDAISKKSVAVYLELLDEDKFLIESVLISRVCEEYTGKLRGNFDMSWDVFSKIKYYDFSILL